MCNSIEQSTSWEANTILGQMENSQHSHTISLTSILILFLHPHLILPRHIFITASLTKILYFITPTCATWLSFHLSNIWWRAQIMKLLIMQFSPVSSHFLLLWFKHSPQHDVLTFSTYFLPSDQGSKFHTHIKQQVKL
jgi:hypothetical protein